MKKLFLFLLTLLLQSVANAFTGEVVIEGIKYHIITKGQSAEVISYNYSGDVVIPETVEYEGVVCYVTSIGSHAFENCSTLSSVFVPSSVTTIGEYAFKECSGLTSVSLTNNVTSIGGYAFMGCAILESFTIPEKLSSIEQHTFHGARLASISIPPNVKKIGNSAFRDCTSLGQVHLEEGLENIDASAFRGCNCLSNIILPNTLVAIGGNAFRDCSSLTSIDIPNSVTSLGGAAFVDCEKLETAIIGDGLPIIDGPIFFQCKSLKNVTIGANVKSISSNAFGSCPSLTTITIPDNVQTLESSAFLNCENLTTIIIGNGCKDIQSTAFARCPEMKDIYCYAESKPVTDATAFENSYANYTTLHVPTSLINTYKASSPWSEFMDVVSLPYIIYKVDNEIYKQDLVMIGTPITPITEPEKEGHTFSGWSSIPDIMPKEDVTITGTFTVNTYTLTYLVDGEVYQTSEVKYGTTIIPEEEPTKTGYTFSGWSSIPTTMPAHDVTVNGIFTINKYKLTYIVDNEEYKTVEVDYNSKITPEAEPTKEGHTFSGWSDIPETMPANDVTVTGSFTVNSYNLTYIVDEEVYKTYEVKYGTTITPEEEPTKTGYSFSGWSEFPSTMPAKDITITGSFIINKYKLTYLIDGIEYKSLEVEYNASISPEAEPAKEGYTFSGWIEIPETMPANDVTITGSFTINKYLVTYIIDGETITTESVEYASTITPPSVPEREGYSFAWNEYPETMPANDITITGQYSINSYKLSYYVDGAEYKSYDVVYKSTITPEAEPIKEGHTFSGWSDIPETMPANDVTITGSFIVNKYKVTYIIDGEVIATDYVEYGTTIVPPTVSEKEGFIFDGWADVPETMPAHDITIYGSFTSGIAEIIMDSANVRIYNIIGKRVNKLQRGINIIISKDGKVRKVNIK